MPNVDTVRCEIWYFRKNREPGRLLDYGFGDGQELIYFAEHGYEPYGIEIDQITKSRFDRHISEHKPELVQRIHTQVLDGSVERLPFEDNWFDFVHSNQVIYFLASEAKVQALLREWHRIMKPGGLLMFSTVGPSSSLIQNGVEIAPDVYEIKYRHPDMPIDLTTRRYLMRDEEHIRSLCEMFDVDEVGWFSNSYCGQSSFHWQILARRP